MWVWAEGRGYGLNQSTRRVLAYNCCVNPPPQPRLVAGFDVISRFELLLLAGSETYMYSELSWNKTNVQPYPHPTCLLGLELW